MAEWTAPLSHLARKQPSGPAGAARAVRPCGPGDRRSADHSFPTYSQRHLDPITKAAKRRQANGVRVDTAAILDDPRAVSCRVRNPSRGLRYKARVPMFLVTLSRSGPRWESSRALEEQYGWPEHASFMDGLVDAGFIVLGGPLAGLRVVHAVEAESEDEIRATLGRDPWSETHRRIDTIEPWTIRLDGRGV